MGSVVQGEIYTENRRVGGETHTEERENPVRRRMEDRPQIERRTDRNEKLT